MTKEQVLGIVRHSLTFIGGILVIRGTIQESMVAELVGSAVALAGVVWSIISKK